MGVAASGDDGLHPGGQTCLACPHDLFQHSLLVLQSVSAMMSVGLISNKVFSCLLMKQAQKTTETKMQQRCAQMMMDSLVETYQCIDDPINKDTLKAGDGTIVKEPRCRPTLKA